jgi:hypothetical protein
MSSPDVHPDIIASAPFYPSEVLYSSDGHAEACPLYSDGHLGGAIYVNRARRKRLFSFLFAPCILVEKTKDAYEEAHWKYRRRMRGVCEEPFRAKNGRWTNLSKTIRNGWSQKGKDARNPLMFLQLPPEIRFMIYDLVVPSKHVDILWRGGKNVGVWYADLGPKPKPVLIRTDGGHRVCVPPDKRLEHCICQRERRVNVMGVLLVCRKL